MKTMTSTTTRANRRGFTLLELMIVFVIIALLISVSLMVGHRVAGSSKIKATQNVLQSLDQAMESYVQAKGGTASKFPDRFVDANKDEFPLADAVYSNTLIPSGELAIELLRNEPASAAILKGIPAEFVTLDTASTVAITGVVPVKTATGNSVTAITLTHIKDAWGQPIRFVHPSYHGIYGTGANPARAISLKRGGTPSNFNIERLWQMTGLANPANQGDGGLCSGGRPYFYSAGPDGNPATIEDNVYSVKPTFDAAVKAAGQ